MRKILVLCGRYGLSGVPLAQQRLAHLLSDRGHKVTFMPLYANVDFVIDNESQYRFQVPGIPSVFKSIPFLVSYFARERFDLIFSAGDHLNAVCLVCLLISFSRSTLCCSSRVTPFDTYFNYKVPFSRSWSIYWLIRLLSWRCSLFSCVSRDMAAQYSLIFPGLTFVPIYNPISLNYGSTELYQSRINPFPDVQCRLLAAGSLEPWKGFDTLINAIALIPDRNFFHLLIAGDGSERANLCYLINDLGLTEHITLVGNIQDMNPFYSFADIFILSSRVEGMPNVLLEALSHQCSVVSTDCPTGPSELLSCGAGLLVPVDDAQSMALAIQSLASTPISPEKCSEALEPFSPSAIFTQYSHILGYPL